MHNKLVNLPYDEGYILGEVLVFEKSDRKQFKEIYNSWSNMAYELKQIGGRRPLFPTELMEGIICLELNMLKVPNNNRVHYDLIDPTPAGDRGRIKVKVALNAANRMQLNEKELMDSDRVIFAKISIENRNDLIYELYQYRTRDILEFAYYNKRALYSRIVSSFSISFNDLMQIPNKIILSNSL